MPDEEFSLLRLIAADLRRHHLLLRGADVPASGLTLLRDAFSPRFIPVLLCRLAHRFHLWHLGPVAKLLSLVNFMLFGLEVAVRCPIGPGLFIPHTQGIVIGAARIGANATIYHGVTLGAKELDFDYSDSRRPFVGDDVLIGSGAKILGGLRIGNGVTVGANAVVLESLPDGILAVGIPARIVQRPSAS